ncbi:MAG TPA: NAD(P)H-hydrate dehydratase [Clostridiaceae bacterium]
MRIFQRKKIREIDEFCIKALNIPEIVLMENAALKILKNIDLNSFNSFVIVCGNGNNGGDGLALGRHLINNGKDVTIFLISVGTNLSLAGQINLNILNSLKAKIILLKNEKDLEIFKDILLESQFTVDCIFGTGLSRNLEGIYEKSITYINNYSKYILSIDVPSGFDCDTGDILGNAVKANKTVTLQVYKEGFLRKGAKEYTGEIIVEDIGIPSIALNEFDSKEYLIDKAYIKSIIKKRDKYGHKGNYGNVLIIAGSKGFAGAAYLAAKGTIRAGAGLVKVATSNDVLEILAAKLTEAILIDYSREIGLKDAIERSDVIAFGPGIGNNDKSLELFQKVLETSDKPLVIDADGLNLLSKNIDLIKNYKGRIIITPHPLEMERLTGFHRNYINENRIAVSKKFAKDNGVIVLLKGYNTVITDGDYLWVNTTGSSAMASSGMGDALTGIIASFIGQGYDIMEGAILAAYLHGYVGDLLSKEMFTVTATDLVEMLPKAIMDFF